MRRLRITAGFYKNFNLQVPRSARPMTDRVKTSVFSIIQSRISNSKVLDLFAGSGAIGIECLSRGADYVKFIEISTEGVNMIRSNLRNCNVASPCYDVVKGDADKLLFKYIHSKQDVDLFDLIFVTPPHVLAGDEYVRLASKLLKKDGLLIAECPSQKTLSEKIDSIYLERLEKYGKTDIYFYLTT